MRKEGKLPATSTLHTHTHTQWLKGSWPGQHRGELISLGRGWKSVDNGQGGTRRQSKAVMWEGSGLTEGKRSVKKVSSAAASSWSPSLRVSSIKRGSHHESSALGRNGGQACVPLMYPSLLLFSPWQPDPEVWTLLFQQMLLPLPRRWETLAFIAKLGAGFSLTS